MADIRAFTMPKWGIEMTEGLVAKWEVAEGQAFERGAVLALVETDKITNEIEAEEPGRFARILAAEGETLPVGALLAVLAGADVPAEAVEAFIQGFQPAGGAPAPKPAAAVAAVAAPAPAKVVIDLDDSAISPRARQLAGDLGVDPSTLAGSGRGGRVTAQDVEQAARPAVAAGKGQAVDIVVPADVGQAFASPSARRAARQHGIDLAKVAPTGPRGRISKADVLALASPARPSIAVVQRQPAVPTVVPMSPMRKAIARRLSEAWSTIPHFIVRSRVDARQLVALRLAATRFLSPAPSLNDLLVRATALALVDVPEINLQVHGDAIHLFGQADIAIAVATDRGLVTPVVRAADQKSLGEIAAETKALVARARDGKLKADEMAGGSFSLSNLGPLGVTEFDAIVNPPQGAILAVGAVHPALLDIDGEPDIVPALALSLSCDHRAIDGALAGRFLAALKGHIERPDAL